MKPRLPVKKFRTFKLGEISTFIHQDYKYYTPKLFERLASGYRISMNIPTPHLSFTRGLWPNGCGWSRAPAALEKPSSKSRGLRTQAASVQKKLPARKIEKDEDNKIDEKSIIKTSQVTLRLDGLMPGMK